MKIVAITSCATGIAHSYMAAEALKKTAKKRGFQIKVEIQGALGIENELSSSDISAADKIIFANDVGITGLQRFDKVKDKIIHTSPHKVIKNPDFVFDEIK
jgi:PTS system fructose-specific IIB component